MSGVVVGVIVFIAFLVACGCTVLGAVSDILKLKIPNLYSLVIVVTFSISIVLRPDIFDSWVHHVATGLGMLILTYIMFYFGLMGGGDSKLATAWSLWLGPSGMPAFLLVMTLCGGVLAVLGLLLKKYRPFPGVTTGWIGALQSGRSAVPYGVAIMVGAFVALYDMGFVQIIKGLSEIGAV